MTNPMVQLTDLAKTFPAAKRPALGSLTAAIPRGVVTGLVGPDGAGKTTLIRLMAGLLLPSAGSVSIESGAFAPSDPPARECIGYMPQKFGLYEDLTVQENLQLHADLRGVVGEERRARFERLLAFTDLARFTKRLAGKLSGGMKQKLGLACALLGRPQLLLLDEPGVGVDPISRRELWKMVHELIGQGLTVVWSTAYLDEAELCAAAERRPSLVRGSAVRVDRPAQGSLPANSQRRWQPPAIARPRAAPPRSAGWRHQGPQRAARAPRRKDRADAWGTGGWSRGGTGADDPAL
jgi:ABC-type multidrug transport system ATPase subunit